MLYTLCTTVQCLDSAIASLHSHRLQISVDVSIFMEGIFMSIIITQFRLIP